MPDTTIKLIECPRDAMQGWKKFIPTQKKIAYLQSLLEVGFDILDFGSFVSAKAIPQMADTHQVLAKLPVSKGKTKLLSIVANLRGAEEAMAYESIDYIGFPFSVSECFQERNTHHTRDQSLELVAKMHALCSQHGKKLVVYISMAFGNPYGDAYSPQIVFDWVNRITDLGIDIISLADTVGVATPATVQELTATIMRSFPDNEIGVHLHTTATNREAKLEAALKAGCRRFDGALKGIGGCPMADDELVGNMDTELMIDYLEQRGFTCNIDKAALKKSSLLAAEIFS